MPWKFDKQTKTEGDSPIEQLIGAIEDAKFIARMMDKGIPLEDLAIRGKLQCNVCKEIIENYEDARRCEDKPVHDGCLKCISCRRHLSDFKVKFLKNKEGTLFHCEPCLQENAERCPYCKEYIEQNHGKIYKGKKYHRKCVELVDVCDECGRSLVESTHMLSLDEPKPESAENIIEVPETPESPGKESPESPESRRKIGAELAVRRRPSRTSRGSRGSKGSKDRKGSRGGSKGRNSSTDVQEKEEEHDSEEGEKKNILKLKKQYCQECFKHIYDMEICHVCKGPLKKNEEAPQGASTSSLQKALAISKQTMLGADIRSPQKPSARNILDTAFKFPDGSHPEEFMFEAFICHWECMQCHTCQKSVIGEPTFIMAEKHRLWCKFCAEHRFSSLMPTPLSPTVTKASLEKRKLNGRQTPNVNVPATPNVNVPATPNVNVPATPVSHTSLGSNIKIGIGPTDIREFKFNTKTARYELEAAVNRTSSKISQQSRIPSTPSSGRKKK